MRLLEAKYSLMEIGKRLTDAIEEGSPQTVIDGLADRYADMYRLVKNWHRARRAVLPATSDYPIITARQAEAIRLVKEGHDNKKIAVMMRITPATVKIHLRNARKRWKRRIEELELEKQELEKQQELEKKSHD